MPMRLLLDSCVWAGARGLIAEQGHDAVWVGDWIADPGDEEILNRAHADQRVLVTLDKDFGELVVVHGRAHCGIVRLVGLAAREQAATLLRVIELHADRLVSGALITVDAKRLRIREAPANAEPSD